MALAKLSLSYKGRLCPISVFETGSCYGGRADLKCVVWLPPSLFPMPGLEVCHTHHTKSSLKKNKTKMCLMLRHHGKLLILFHVLYR